MKKPKHFLVKLMPYTTKVLVSLGEDEETIVKTLNGYKCPKHMIIPLVGDLLATSKGFYVDFLNGFVLLCIKNYPVTIDDFATIVHEVTHVIQASLEYAGIQITEATTEVYAYLAGFLYKEILKKI